HIAPRTGDGRARRRQRDTGDEDGHVEELAPRPARRDLDGVEELHRRGLADVHPEKDLRHQPEAVVRFLPVNAPHLKVGLPPKPSKEGLTRWEACGRTDYVHRGRISLEAWCRRL